MAQGVSKPFRRGYRRASDAESADRYVSFEVGSVSYALSAAHARRSIRVLEQPQAQWVTAEGTYDVINLRSLFGLPSLPPKGMARSLVLVDAPAGRSALVADSVEALVDIRAGDVRPLPALFRGREREWFSGVAVVDGRLLIVVRPAALGTALAHEQRLTTLGQAG